MSTPGSEGRLRQLDGLRALASVVVVLHHAGAAAVASAITERGLPTLGNLLSTGTASGVELFFVLSGVVLLRPYLRKGRSLDVPDYFRRRAERLWPPFLAAWVLAGLTTLLTTLFPTWWTAGAGLPAFDLLDWVAQLGIVYVGRARFNWAWWSLTVELLFYLLVPAVLFLLSRWRRTSGGLLAVWVCTVVAALAAQQLPAGSVPFHAWPLPTFLTYLSCFAAGVVLAAADLPPAWGPWMMGAGLFAAVAACAVPALDVHVGWGLFYFGLVTATLESGGALARWFSRWPLIWLGERSYSLFLVHFSVFTCVSLVMSMLVPAKGPFYFVSTRLIELPLALLVAMLVFDRVERRFARGLMTGEAFWPSLEQAEPAPRTRFAKVQESSARRAGGAAGPGSTKGTER